MNILIVEGNAGDIEMMESAVEQAGASSRIIICARDLETSLEILHSKHSHPDLIFLPSSITANENMHALKKLNLRAPILHRRESVEGCDSVQQVELFVHPGLEAETPNKVKNAEIIYGFLNRAGGSLQTGTTYHLKERFLVRNSNKLKTVTTQEIAYFYSDRKLNFLRTWEGHRYIVEQTMESLNQVLDSSRFFRINRSYIISYSAIRDIHLHFGSRLKLLLTPQVEEDVFVSREKVSAFRKWIGE